MALTSTASLSGPAESAQAQVVTGQAKPRRISFLGFRIDDTTLDEVLTLSREAMKKRHRLQHGDLNVAKFIASKHDRDFFRFTEESDLVCADGMGIVWGCRLLGTPVRERVTGCDLMMRLIELCAREGFRPYFLGAKQNVLEAAVARARCDNPGLEIAGWRHGYFGRDEELDIVAAIRASGADCLFVGISSPTKERFLNEHRDALNVPVQLAVGGSFDVLAGKVRRAPTWMQRCGLEWFFRLAQEPTRLGRRYLVTNARFALVMLSALADRTRQQLTTQARQVL